MKANPGGIITGESIIDRDKEIAELWETIEQQSIVLISERRVGKTSILRKLKENPVNQWKAILYMVEGKLHPIDFVEQLYDELKKEGIVDDNFVRLRRLYNKYIGGGQIANWKFPQIKENWVNLFYSLIEDISDTESKIILMLDELPLMIHKFLKIHGPELAMGFLDILREVRNKYEGNKNIRFIFSGSIGLDIIIDTLKRDHSFVSEPLNNMCIYPLGRMNHDGAKLLCDKLCEGEGIVFSDKDIVIERILEVTSYLPFYIQLTFKTIQKLNTEITVGVIDEIVYDIINDPFDRGWFNHYIDRIVTYYNESIIKLSMEVLSLISKSSDYISEIDIFNRLKQNHKFSNLDFKTTKDVIEVLRNDHYLVRRVDQDVRFYDFKYSLIKNWWRINNA